MRKQCNRLNSDNGIAMMMILMKRTILNNLILQFQRNLQEYCCNKYGTGLKISISSHKILISGLKISISSLKISISGLKMSISGHKILISSLKKSITGL